MVKPGALIAVLVSTASIGSANDLPTFKMDNIHVNTLKDKNQGEFNKWDSEINDPVLSNCISNVMDIFPEDCALDQASKDVVAFGITACHKKRFKRKFLKSSDGDEYCAIDTMKSLLIDFKETLQALPNPSEVYDGSLQIADTPGVVSLSSGRPLSEVARDLGERVSECGQNLTDEAYADWRQWYTHMDNVCYYVQSTQWQRRTENLVNSLTSGVDAVNHQVTVARLQQEELLRAQQIAISSQTEFAAQMGSQLAHTGQAVTGQLDIMRRTAEESNEQIQRTLGSVMTMFSSVDDLHRMLLGEFFGISALLSYMVAFLVAHTFTSFKATKPVRIAIYLLWLSMFVFEYLFVRVAAYYVPAHLVGRITSWLRYGAMAWGTLVMVSSFFRFEDPLVIQARQQKLLVEKIESIQQTIEQEEQRAFTRGRHASGVHKSGRAQSVSAQSNVSDKILPTLISAMLTQQQQQDFRQGAANVHQNLVTNPIQTISNMLSLNNLRPPNPIDDPMDEEYRGSKRERKEVRRFERELERDMATIDRAVEEQWLLERQSSVPPSHGVSNTHASGNHVSPPVSQDVMSQRLNMYGHTQQQQPQVHQHNQFPDGPIRRSQFEVTEFDAGPAWRTAQPASSYGTSSVLTTNFSGYASNPAGNYNQYGQTAAENGNTFGRLVNNVRRSVRKSFNLGSSSTSSSSAYPHSTGESGVASSVQSMELQYRQHLARRHAVEQRFNLRPRNPSRARFFDPRDPECWARLNGAPPPSVNPQMMVESEEDFVEKIRQSRIRRVTETLIAHSLQPAPLEDAPKSRGISLRGRSKGEVLMADGHEVRHPPEGTLRDYVLRDPMEMKFLFGKEKARAISKSIKKIL